MILSLQVPTSLLFCHCRCPQACGLVLVSVHSIIIWHCTCPKTCNFVVAIVRRFVILSLQMSTGLWVCYCRCPQVCDFVTRDFYTFVFCHCGYPQVCDIAIAGVHRFVIFVSLHVSTGLCFCLCRCAENRDYITGSVYELLILLLQVSSAICLYHYRCQAMCVTITWATAISWRTVSSRTTLSTGTWA